MAAPITPVKTIVEIGKSEFCLLCKNESKRLHCLTKFKATKEDYVKKIQQFTGQTLELSLLHSMCVCESCVLKCQNAIEFKKMCSDNICQFHYNVQRRQKRMPKTPPSTLKSTVAEQIEHSVEKLKHISLEEERKPKKSKQKLSFNTSEAATDTQVIDTPDHGYCRPKLVQSKEQDDKVTISEMMERFSVNVSQSICNSVEQVSRFGKSVLFTKETGELCKRNWFKDIAIEMSEKCPELFQVLFSAIGDKISMESKLATISTIYGMILHCHNVKACAVQRIFTALCIRYHADNKVFICSPAYALVHIMAYSAAI
eukprot:XP_011431816.1 PREDICTED: uncharacterized protein LOC105331370 isoform X2 [Crassostrea gigas]